MLHRAFLTTDRTKWFSIFALSLHENPINRLTQSIWPCAACQPEIALDCTEMTRCLFAVRCNNCISFLTARCNGAPIFPPFTCKCRSLKRRKQQTKPTNKSLFVRTYIIERVVIEIFNNHLPQIEPKWQLCIADASQN